MTLSTRVSKATQSGLRADRDVLGGKSPICSFVLLGRAKQNCFRIDVVHFSMVIKHVLRQPFQNPNVPERIVRGHSCIRVPVETSVDEVEEVLVISLDHHAQRLGERNFLLSFDIIHDIALVLLIEELVLVR